MAARRTARPAEGQQQQGPTLRRLLPPGEPVGVEQFADTLELPAGSQPADRPYVLLNMVSTADGRANLGGRSGPIGNRADHELFRALRTAVDGVMVGAGTVRVERYGRMLRSERLRRLRERRGRSPEPLACIVSGSLSLPPDLPLLATPEARVAILTSSQATLPESAAEVHYVRATRGGELDLAAALGELRARFELDTLLCEGGPHLNAELLSAGLVDELFLSLAAKLAGEDADEASDLRILAGRQLPAPVELELLSVLESEGALFLRYGVCASAAVRVSRETMPNSSLAS